MLGFEITIRHNSNLNSVKRLIKTSIAIIKGIVLQIFHLKKNLSCMVLNGISVFGKVYKWSPEKIVLQKHH